jgi:hypothetical protein
MTRGFLTVVLASLLCTSGPAVHCLYSADGSSEAPGPGEKKAAVQEESAAPPSKPAVAQTDSSLALVPLDDGHVLSQRLEENAARPLSTYLAVGAREFYGIERYEMTRLECALTGLDSGLTLGLFAGALGMTAGLWEERTAWYVVGAAAALGALRGVSKADDPAFRVQLRWENPDRGP